MIAKQTIEVDSELQPQAVMRALSTEENVLLAYANTRFYKTNENLMVVYRRTFSTLTIRLARLTVNSFLENIDLVVRTLEEFGEEAERSSSK